VAKGDHTSLSTLTLNQQGQHSCCPVTRNADHEGAEAMGIYQRERKQPTT